MSEFSAGVWAAALTPMDSQLNIDTDRYIRHIRYLLGKGCNGVALFGTTGEANSFSITEKLVVLAEVAKAGFDTRKIMVGTGCCATSDTVTLTQSAIKLGFRNFLVLPPFYYKGVSEQGVFNAYAHIIAALPQNGVSIIIYDIPQMSGVDISLELLIKLRNAFPGIIKGVKNSTGDWQAIQATCAAMPGFAVFAGTEQYLLPTLQAGGAGCISATANVTSQKLGEIYAQWQNASAENLQNTATQTRLMLQQFPPAPALKQILARCCGHQGWINIRPPLMGLNQNDVHKLFEILDTSGLPLNEKLSFKLAV